jgi:hypothetical protein
MNIYIGWFRPPPCLPPPVPARGGFGHPLEHQGVARPPPFNQMGVA